MNKYFTVNPTIIDSQDYNASLNPNVPKMPLEKDNKFSFVPFYEFKQPWRSSYYESSGITHRKLNQTVNDFSDIPPEYSEVQPILNLNLTRNAYEYSRIMREQNMDSFYQGKPTIQTPTYYNGYRLPSEINNDPTKYGMYISRTKLVIPYVINNVINVDLMKNTFRPCKLINGNYVYSDTLDQSPIMPGLKCSPRTGFLTMPNDPSNPDIDKTFGFYANSSQRVPLKIHPDVVKIITEYLPQINTVGFNTYEEAITYRRIFSDSMNSETGKLFVMSLLVYDLNTKFYLLPNLVD